MTYIFRKPLRPITRVFIHCSASDNPDHDNVATMDLWHKQRGWAGVGYHFFVRKVGLLEIGRDIEKTPAAQEGNNTGTIAICLHGLKAEKFTQAQFSTLKELCRQIYDAYDGQVTFHGHCEVARKACPVFDYRKVLELDAKGRLGALATAVAVRATPIETPTILGIEHLEQPGSFGVGILQMGVKNGAVTVLQQTLTSLGYFVGNIDGDFGTRTRDAVLAAQADNHLTPDGKVGPLTREALRAAKPRPVSEVRAAATTQTLISSGSPVAKASAKVRSAGFAFTAGGLASTLGSLTGVTTILKEQAGDISAVTQALGPLQGPAMLAFGVYVIWLAAKTGRAAVEDYRSGKTA